MSTERIKQLHDEASERYLRGDYQGALEAWRNVLGLDPADEQALGGLRLASQFVEHVSPAFAEGTGRVEHELEQGLKVLDGLGATTLLHPDTADGTSDRKPDPGGVQEPAQGEILSGWEMPAEPRSEEGSFGLEPISRSSPAPIPGLSAAAAELSRRVNDLLAEAKAKGEAGERDEALAILSRLAILDEDNAEAAALRAKLESQGDSNLDKVERAIIEGVAALEADRLDDAERHLREALRIVPDHREARHYLQKVAERRAGGGGEELLGAGRSESAPTENAVQRAVGIEAAPRPKAPSPVKSPVPVEAQKPPDSPPKSSRFVLPPAKILIWAGVGVVVLVCAVLALSRVGRSAPSETAVRKPVAPLSRPKRQAKPGPSANRGATPAAPVVPASPEEAAKTIASSLAKGHELMASGDFGGAVIAYNEALALNPKNTEARSGLEQAGERYKANKAEREAVNAIRLAFRDGEYTSGLRLAYRLPPSVSKSYTDSVKVAGWFNLAVVALRAGECREALSHLDEAAEIAPADGDVKKLRELAMRYADAVKDRAFLAQVEALSFRPLPPS
jgi:tetratricopeptide (TPR) repeat protein